MRKPNDPEDDLLSPGTVAAMVGHESTRGLETWRRRGVGPRFVRLNSRTIRYRRRDVEQWLATLGSD